MKIHPQHRAELAPLAEQLGRYRVGMLTLDEGGEGLASRPMTPLEMDRDGAIWFIASRRTLGFLHAVADAPANLAFVHESDADYVSVAGRVAFHDDIARKQALWSVMARPWFSGPDDPDLVVLKFTPQRAEVWDGPDNAAARLLALAASVVAGRELGLGQKTVIESTLPG